MDHGEKLVLPFPRGLPKLTALMIAQHTNETVCLAGVVEPICRLGISRLALFQEWPSISSTLHCQVGYRSSH